MTKQFIIVFLILSASAFAQEDKRGTIVVKKPKKDEVIVSEKSELTYTIARQNPMFEGGQVEMNKFIAKNLKYPEAEKAAKIQGAVYVGFVVEEDGSITSSRISQGVQGGPGLDKEALRIVSIMPKWVPGYNGREKRAMRYILPIKFTL